MDAPTDRRARRREETRQKLMAATRALVARQGVESIRIQEITEEADVGFGSFYNHFESKDAIIEAVLSETVAAQGAALAVLISELEDPAETIAVAHRTMIRQVRDDADWGWLLVHLDVSHDIIFHALGEYARQDIRRGIDSGRLAVPDETVALFQTGGALLGVMRAVLDGRASDDVDVHHAEGVLRLLGLPGADAAEVARRPLPEPADTAPQSPEIG